MLKLLRRAYRSLPVLMTLNLFIDFMESPSDNFEHSFESHG